MSKKIVTPPDTPPVTLTEVKRQRRITGSDEDAELTRLIVAAREYAENYLNSALITQTWDLFLDSFSSAIELPRYPLQSVTTVKYTDTAGVQQTLDSGVYTVSTHTVPGKITLAYNQDWPDIQSVVDAVEIRFVAGYGDASTDVPEAIRNAMFLLIGHWHENTEASSVVNLNNIPFGITALLDQSRVHTL